MCLLTIALQEPPNMTPAQCKKWIDAYQASAFKIAGRDADAVRAALEVAQENGRSGCLTAGDCDTIKRVMQAHLVGIVGRAKRPVSAPVAAPAAKRARLAVPNTPLCYKFAEYQSRAAAYNAAKSQYAATAMQWSALSEDERLKAGKDHDALLCEAGKIHVLFSELESLILEINGKDKDLLVWLVKSIKTAIPVKSVKSVKSEKPPRVPRAVGTAAAVAASLHEDGYCITPLLTPEECGAIRDAMCAWSPPELAEARTPETLLQLGGFAAIGLPSMYQHPAVRGLQSKFYHAMLPKLSALSESLGLDEPHVQLMMDRYLIRSKSQKPMVEGCHRDVFDAKLAKSSVSRCPGTDIIFGGGINLSDVPQYFSVAPGTQVNSGLPPAGAAGFSAISAAELPYFEDKLQRIMVPPGHAFTMNQTIVHAVSAGLTKAERALHPAQPDQMHRLFTAIRLTNTACDALIDYSNVFDDGAAPLLPSGQIPALYSLHHGSVYLEKSFNAYKNGPRIDGGVVGWSKQFKPAFIKAKTRHFGPRTGVRYAVIPRHCPSLRSAGQCEHIAVWPAAERALYRPHPL